MIDLETIRQSIDEVDRELVALFERRMSLAKQVADYKKQSGGPVYNPEREKVVIGRAGAAVSEELSSYAESLFSTLTRLSRGKQYEIMALNDTYTEGLKASREAVPAPCRVGYQGIALSYSNIVADTVFPAAEKVGYSSFLQACEGVKKGEVDLCVLPIDNTTEGGVNEVYDRLFESGLYIVQAVNYPISHCLLGVKGTSLDQIRRVVSHPQALAQCRELTEKHGWEASACENTAVAAERVAKLCDQSLAAIGSAQAARHYGLEVLAEGINPEGNTTRFVVLSRDCVIAPEAEKVSIAFTLEHRSGALADVIGGLADHGLNLTKIQSRPLPDRPWEYCFYMDFMGRPFDREVLASLIRIRQESPCFKFLGWYPESRI